MPSSVKAACNALASWSEHLLWHSNGTDPVQGSSDSSDEDAEGPDEYDLNDTFIAGDEDEDEGRGQSQAEAKRRKRAKKRSREEEQLDEEDYQLLQEAVSPGPLWAAFQTCSHILTHRTGQTGPNSQTAASRLSSQSVIEQVASEEWGGPCGAFRHKACLCHGPCTAPLVACC